MTDDMHRPSTQPVHEFTRFWRVTTIYLCVAVTFILIVLVLDLLGEIPEVGRLH